MNHPPLTIHETTAADSGRGIVRLDPDDMKARALRSGDIAKISGPQVTFGRVLPMHQSERGQMRVQIDPAMRKSAAVNLGDRVCVTKSAASTADDITLALNGPSARDSGPFEKMLRAKLDHVPLSTGDTVRLHLLDGRELFGQVTHSAPDGAVFLGEQTNLRLTFKKASKQNAAPAYEDLGGLGPELARVREMIELPIKRPEIFLHLGIEAPKGVLLSGPPGTGKTLLARAVAEECNAHFFQINGPEIIGKHYGESEKQLRDVFKQAQAKAPSIVFIDELDAIAPKREMLAGDKQVERRIVAQLLTLLDGMKGRGQIIIMAATNLPDSLDPALRRPGRFDREIRIGAPDRAGRREILDVHTRGMPLDADVDLDALAGKTHGYVGADLAALCREAGMAALRQAAKNGLAATDMLDLTIDASAFAETRPSALRDVYGDIPDVTFADIGGLDDLKETLREAVIWPLLHGDSFRILSLSPAKGVLLAGAPGTGKTLIAQAVAHEAGVNFIAVAGPALLNQYIGESERAVRDVFMKARATAPCIIFFDEIDAIAPVRGGGDGAVLERVVAQFLVEIDGMESLKDVFLLGATNRVDRVDPALLRPGRFDLVIDMPRPDMATRARILQIHTRNMPLAGDVDLAPYAEKTSGFVGADLGGFVQIAGRCALRRSVQDGTPPMVHQTDFEAAFEIATKSQTARGLTPNKTTDQMETAHGL